MAGSPLLVTTGRQLALRFPLSERARLDSFVVGDNAELLRRLEQLVDGPGFAGCFLYGRRGVGRSHLLQAACHRRAPEAGARAIYLPLADARVTPAFLEGLERVELVALDDLDRWLTRPEAEAALIALYQGLAAAGGRLLVSADAPAGRLEFHLPDLASRMRGLPAYRVRPLADADKTKLLERLARERGLRLGTRVIEFWLARTARDLPSLLDDLERLDHAAMAAQRRVTVALVKEVLGL